MEMVNKMDRLDTILGQFGEQIEDWMESLFLPSKSSTDVRLHKSGDVIVIEMDMPGVKIEDVKITVNDGQMNVAWKRSSLARTISGESDFSISKTADLSKITAKLAHGLMVISIPRAAEGKPSSVSIPITSG